MREASCASIYDRIYPEFSRIFWGLFKDRVKNIRYSLCVVSSVNYRLQIARVCRRMLSTGNIMIPRKVNWIVAPRVVELMNRVAAVEFAFLPLWTDGQTRMVSQARSYEFRPSVTRWIVLGGLDTDTAVMLVNYPRSTRRKFPWIPRRISGSFAEAAQRQRRHKQNNRIAHER